jgi:predicted MPP superfamily phosphohydrolase
MNKLTEMSKIRFLHISDAHFPEKEKFEYEKTIDALFNYLKKRNITFDIIFFTGDLSAKGQDYSYATSFFDKLLIHCGLANSKENAKTARKYLIFIPGNHDVDRSVACYPRIANLTESYRFFENSWTEYQKIVYSSFCNFINFYNTYYEGIRRYSNENHCLSEIIEIKGISIGVVGFNSAVFSKDDHDKGKLYIGESLCKKAFENVENADIVISLHHHPIDWLAKQEKNNIKNIFIEYSDIDLSGHEHTLKSYSEESTCWLQSGTLYENQKVHSKAFIGTIDLNKYTVDVEAITYDHKEQMNWIKDTRCFGQEVVNDYVKSFTLNSVKKKLNLSHKTTYINRIKRQLNSELSQKTASFISLGLSHFLGISLKKDRSNEEFSINDLQDKITDKPVLLLGGPGAGKSTILLKFAIQLCELKNSFIPIHIKLGILNSYDSLYEAINLSDFSDEEKRALFINGNLYVIFDGINESEININKILEDIYQLHTKYPKCKYIASCRSLEFPINKKQYFDIFDVLPVSNQQIKEQFSQYIGVQLGEKFYNQLQEGRMTYLMDMCRIPLLLSMVMQLLQDNKSNISDLSLKDIDFLSSKAIVYENFHEHIKSHQQNRNYTYRYADIEEDLLKNIGFKMQQMGKVYISEIELKSIIKEFDPINSISQDILNDCRKQSPTWYYDAYNYIQKLPFFNLSHWQHHDYKISFIHQSFQEFFAGNFINDKYLSYEQDVFNLINDTTKRNWETLEFACCLNNGEKIVEKILDCAIKCKEQDLLILVSKCIMQQTFKNSSTVDNCCIKMVEAFKFWGNPFDYELIYSIEQLYPYTSHEFPQRLKRDITRFTDKYNHLVSPIEYSELYTLNTLKDFIANGNEFVKIDAIYTLGRRKWKMEDISHVGNFLVSLLHDTAIKEEEREFIIKSFKDLKHYDASNILQSIINDKNDTPRVRAYALNAIASIGNIDAVDDVVSYLRNHNNPYRDSASWTLQSLALIAKEKGLSEKVEEIKKCYYECLITETDDIEGIFSKGNILYSLSKLDAIEYFDELTNWILTQSDAYVIEDALYCISTLGKEKSIKTIRKYQKFSDKVIQEKVKEYLDKYCN